MATKKFKYDVNRLCDAMHRSRLSLRRFRENHYTAVEQYVGENYSEDGTTERVPVNLISLYISIVGRSLVPKNPRVMLSTFQRPIKPIVAAMQSWANQQIVHMQLANTLRRVVVNGLFSIGIAKVSLADPGQAAYVGWKLAAGQPFIERVDLDDFVYDVRANDFNEVSFIGHRYRVPLDVVKDSKYYGSSRKQLEPSTGSPYNVEGDRRVSSIGRGMYNLNSEDFEDHVDLWEVYLPRHGTVITLADDYLTGAAVAEGRRGKELEPLRTQRWIGPHTGPYHILPFGVVPGNAMPKAPVQDLMSLHEAANRGYRKFVNTLDNIKEVVGVRSGATDSDGKRVVESNHGDVIRMDDPKNIAQMLFGVQSIQAVLGATTELKNLFSYMGGNLQILGGRGPESPTAHQDEMLKENSMAGVQDLQDATTDFVSEVARAFCWYWWHDPFTVQQTLHQLPGMPEFSVLRQITPIMRKMGRFEDLDIRVDPYSMQHQTPQSRMKALNQIMTTIIIPMMPLLQQQGVTLDINSYLQKVASYMDMPDLGEITSIVEPPDKQYQSPGQDQPRMPTATTRTNIRESRSTRTPQSTDRDATARFMGHNMGGNPETSKNGTGFGG